MPIRRRGRQASEQEFVSVLVITPGSQRVDFHSRPEKLRAARQLAPHLPYETQRSRIFRLAQCLPLHSTRLTGMGVMLNLKVWSMSSGCFMAISFVICVVGGLIAPSLPIPHQMLEVLPGFVWISPAAFVLGLVETFAFGLYAGLLFVLLHNFFASYWNASRPTSSNAKAA